MAAVRLVVCNVPLKAAAPLQRRHCAEQFEPKSGVTFLRSQSERGSTEARSRSQLPQPPALASEMNNNLVGDEVG